MPTAFIFYTSLYLAARISWGLLWSFFQLKNKIYLDFFCSKCSLKYRLNRKIKLRGLLQSQNPRQDFLNKGRQWQLIHMCTIENFSNKVPIVKGSSSDHSPAYLSRNSLLHTDTLTFHKLSQVNLYGAGFHISLAFNLNSLVFRTL